MGKIKEPRKPRSYKITDTAYNKALKKSKKEKPLATHIEEIVTAIGKGYEVILVNINSKKVI